MSTHTSVSTTFTRSPLPYSHKGPRSGLGEGDINRPPGVKPFPARRSPSWEGSLPRSVHGHVLPGRRVPREKNGHRRDNGLHSRSLFPLWEVATLWHRPRVPPERLATSEPPGRGRLAGSRRSSARTTLTGRMCSHPPTQECGFEEWMWVSGFDERRGLCLRAQCWIVLVLSFCSLHYGVSGCVYVRVCVCGGCVRVCVSVPAPQGARSVRL